MQMQNGKISLRQYKRLLFFDMVGLGLVILPDLLARHAERAGGCSIFLGALLASLYGGLLLACMRGGVRDRSWLYLPYGIYLLFVGSFGLYLLADLVHTFLLPEESFLLLTVLILLLVLYSRRAGLEGRGRTFAPAFDHPIGTGGKQPAWHESFPPAAFQKGLCLSGLVSCFFGLFLLPVCLFYGGWSGRRRGSESPVERNL